MVRSFCHAGVKRGRLWKGEVGVGPKCSYKWKARIWGTKSELYLKSTKKTRRTKKKQGAWNSKNQKSKYQRNSKTKWQNKTVQSTKKKIKVQIKHQKIRNLNPKNTYHGETGAWTGAGTWPGADRGWQIHTMTRQRQEGKQRLKTQAVSHFRGSILQGPILRR